MLYTRFYCALFCVIIYDFKGKAQKNTFIFLTSKK